MRCSRLLTATIALSASVTALAQGPTYRLGTTPSEEEIKVSDTAISPDGRELPPGSGTVREGATVYAQKCAACHGPNGTGTALHRGLVPLGNAKPVKIAGQPGPVRDDGVGLHQPRHASGEAGIAHSGRSLRGDRLRALSKQRHQRDRRPGCDDASESADAESRQFPSCRDRLEAGTEATAWALPTGR